MADPNEQIHVNTTEARGATTPGMTRYVLGASLLLVVIAFVAIWFIFMG